MNGHFSKDEIQIDSVKDVQDHQLGGKCKQQQQQKKHNKVSPQSN